MVKMLPHEEVKRVFIGADTEPTDSTETVFSFKSASLKVYSSMKTLQYLWNFVAIWTLLIEFSYAWQRNRFINRMVYVKLSSEEYTERISTHKRLTTLFRKKIQSDPVNQIQSDQLNHSKTVLQNVSPKVKNKSDYKPSLGRFFNKDKSMYRSEANERLYEEEGKSQTSDKDNIQTLLAEMNEFVEDLTTPDNLVHFQPDFDEDISPKVNHLSNPNTSSNEESIAFKSGFVSIIGNPNVGKSTLMNFLLRQKLSIVSAKPQTTRHRIHGILTEEGKYQIVFMDTPGMLYNNKAAYALHETMQSVIRFAARDTDLLLLITDVFGDELQDSRVMERLVRAPFPVLVVINKIDLLPDIQHQLRTSPQQLKERFGFNETLPKLIHENITLTRARLNSSMTLENVQAAWRERLPSAEIVPVSAAYNLGVDQLLTTILAHLKPGPKYYPSDYVSDRDERFFTSEIIRETIFELFEGDVPYGCEVQIDQFTDVNPSFSKVHATIYVTRKSQVSILVGREGRKIKAVGNISRLKLEKFLDRKINLQLEVKNDPDWRSKKQSLKRFGYLEEE